MQALLGIIYLQAELALLNKIRLEHNYGFKYTA